MGIFETLDYTTIALTGGSVFLLTCWIISKQKGPNLPPGPWGVPVFGYMLFMGKNRAKTFWELSSKYGDIMSVKIGTQLVVILNERDMITEAFVEKREIFSDRVQNIFNDIDGGNGLMFVNYGESWKKQKSFAKQHIIGSGLTNKVMEAKVAKEVEHVIKVLEERKENSFSAKDLLINAVGNSLCNILLGIRFAYDDERLSTIIASLGVSSSPLVALMIYLPFLRHFPPFSGVFRRITDNKISGTVELRKIVQQRTRNLDKIKGGDFLKKYIEEMSNNPSFHEDQLVMLLWDILFGGLNGPFMAVLWSLLCFAHHPEYQEKMWREVQEIIGKSNTPTMEHRSQMPYTCSFMEEILRHRAIAPATIPHATSRDTIFRGYNIPKNTTVLGNIWGVQYDVRNFDDPEEFRPERFLDSNGRFTPSDRTIPFSIGPRQCLGPPLANMEIFLLLVGIVQKFKIVPDPEIPLPPFEDGEFLPLHAPKEFQVFFQAR